MTSKSLKFLVLFSFLCYLLFAWAAITYAQVPVPQINLTGNIGCQGFPCLNSGVLQFTSDASRVMTAQESSATGGIKVTSSVPLTTVRNLVLPLGNFQFVVIENATTGGQAIQVIGQSGTGVTIANGSSATVWFDGTNVVQAGSSGGGGGAPSGGNYAIQYANSGAFGGANFTGFVFNNASSQPPTQATQAQLFGLLGFTPGSAAAANTGNTGHTLPFLDANNSHSGSDEWTDIGANTFINNVGVSSASTSDSSQCNFIVSGIICDNSAGVQNLHLETEAALGGSLTIGRGSLHTQPQLSLTESATGATDSSGGITWQFNNASGALETKSLQVLTSYLNGVGFQIATVATCTSTTTQFQSCTVTVPLPVTEPDTSYHTSCTVNNMTGSNAVVSNVNTQTTTAFVAAITQMDASPITGGTIVCTVTHP